MTKLTANTLSLIVKMFPPFTAKALYNPKPLEFNRCLWQFFVAYGHSAKEDLPTYSLLIYGESLDADPNKEKLFIWDGFRWRSFHQNRTPVILGTDVLLLNAVLEQFKEFLPEQYENLILLFNFVCKENSSPLYFQYLPVTRPSAPNTWLSLRLLQDCIDNLNQAISYATNTGASYTHACYLWAREKFPLSKSSTTATSAPDNTTSATNGLNFRSIP